MEIKKTFDYTPRTVEGGYTDRILNVNLDTNEINILKLPPDYKHKYIGGRGYALKIIWDNTNSKTKYDSNENVLVMAGGPLCGDPRFPGSGKFIVGSISPLTGTFIDSNIGGHFAPLLKMCGFDALAISGIAKEDVIVVVDGDEGSISIKKAPLYSDEEDSGAITFGENVLKELNGGEYNENMAAVTNGIGAKNTRYGIINSLYYDKRRKRIRSKQAGRGGTGTVMRYKGLRAVVVKSSLPRVSANNPTDNTGVKEAGSCLKKVVSKNDSQQLSLGNWGTTVLVEYMNKFHILPVNNYQYGQHADAASTFASVYFEEYFEKKTPDGCYLGCNLACAKGAEKVLLSTGPYKGREVGIDAPEYESIGAVTCMGIFDAQYIMEFSYYCDEYGLDTISTGVTMAFLMECVQRGYLSKDEIGYDLKWGDIESVDRLLYETANGTGFGKICGNGVFWSKNWIAENYSKKTGADVERVLGELSKFAMEAKGLEFSMYITKESLAQQGGYGFALKGPQHDEAWLIFIDQVHKELPTFKMKAEALKWFPLIRTWFNAVGLCKLPWIDVRNPEAAKTANPAQNLPTLEYYVKYFNSTVGTDKSLQDILDDSERLQLLQKLINLRQGRGTRESDQIPARAIGPVFMNEYNDRAEYYEEWLKEQTGNETLPEKPEECHEILMKLREEAYGKLCDTVYEEKGYNNNAVPLPETLDKFGLLDEQAIGLLKEHGLELDYRILSN